MSKKSKGFGPGFLQP